LLVLKRNISKEPSEANPEAFLFFAFGGQSAYLTGSSNVIVKIILLLLPEISEGYEC